MQFTTLAFNGNAAYAALENHIFVLRDAALHRPGTIYTDEMRGVAAFYFYERGVSGGFAIQPLNDGFLLMTDVIAERRAVDQGAAKFASYQEAMDAAVAWIGNLQPAIDKYGFQFDTSDVNSPLVLFS